MFTGIIHHRAKVLSTRKTAAGIRIELSNPFADVRLGDSIAVDGCCLTVAEMAGEGGERRMGFDVIPETLSKTTTGGLQIGAEVHVEQSLRMGDRVDGHLVQGHVDGVGEVTRVIDDGSGGGEWRATIRVPKELGKYLVPKGSISVAGVSLTLARVSHGDFDITLIPMTLQLTTLGQLRTGTRVNLECDSTVKTIVSTLEKMGIGTGARLTT